MIEVLVTGANGQLGQCIKDASLGYPHINLIFTDYLDLDICNLESVYAFFKAQKNIHYCINCAAYTAVDKAETEVEKAFEINGSGAKNLAMACSKNNTVLIHVSTDFVFDGEKEIPYIETDPTHPISVYGKSKRQGEKGIIEIFDTYFIIRTSWLYSEHATNFMITMLRLAETRNELGIVRDQTGAPTYAGDLSEFILKLISEKHSNYGIYHYSNEGAISWYEFAKAIFDVKGINIKVKPIETKDYPTLAKRPVYSVLDTSKINKAFNAQIPNWKHSLKKAISRFEN